MTNEEKQEKLKKRRRAYQRNKTNKDSTQLKKIAPKGGRNMQIWSWHKKQKMCKRKAEIRKYAARAKES